MDDIEGGLRDGSAGDLGDCSAAGGRWEVGVDRAVL